MKLLHSLTDVIQEEIHSGTELYDHYWEGSVFVKWFLSPHVYDLRNGKPRIPDERILNKMIDESSPRIVEKYFKSGNRYKNVNLDDEFHPRFIVRRVRGESRPQMVVQIEEYNFEKNIMTLQVITFLDINLDLITRNTGEKRVRFIMDL
jgi:hypothetical protein